MAYYGGKNSFLTTLLPQVKYTPHDVYVEMFAGSLALLLNKPPARFEIANDLSQEIFNFWNVLREQPQALIRAVALTPGGELPMHAARDAPPTDDMVEMARRTYVRIMMSFGGKPGAGATNTMRNTLNYLSHRAKDNLVKIAARIENVMIENTDGPRLIQRTLDHIARHELDHLPEDPAARAAACLFYCDPPYLAAARRTGGGEYIEDYRGTESEEFHNRFLDAALDGAKLGCRFIISGYPSELYNDRLTGWWRLEFEKHVSSTHKGTAGKAIECIWRNYDLTPSRRSFFQREKLEDVLKRRAREKRMARYIGDPDDADDAPPPRP